MNLKRCWTQFGMRTIEFQVVQKSGGLGKNWPDLPDRQPEKQRPTRFSLLFPFILADNKGASLIPKESKRRLLLSSRSSNSAGDNSLTLHVSKKIICSVPSLWDLAEYSRRRCDDSSHKHLSRAQANRFETQGRVRWLRRPNHEGQGGVLKLLAPPLGRLINQVTIRDASCRVGALVVTAAANGELWARVMMAHIAMRTRDSERRVAPGGEFYLNRNL